MIGMTLAATVLSAYLAALGGLAAFQRRMVFAPERRYATPKEAGLPQAEELRLGTEDGETLIAWHAPPRPGKPVLLYFHGNAGALADRAARFRKLIARGYGLVALSYRGYGGSTGAPSQDGLFIDGDAAYAETARRYDPARIVIVGESLGTGVAVHIAAQRPAAGVLLDAPFLSALHVAETRFPWVPVRFLMRDPFRSDLRITELRMPVLIAHGDADAVVPFESGRRLFALANEPKHFLAAPGEGHLVLESPQVFPAVADWIDRVGGRTRREPAGRPDGDEPAAFGR